MKKGDINKQVIDNFVANNGERANKILTILGKNQPFIDAITSEIGQELMKDAVIMTEDILMKIADEKASELERAEYRALRKIISRWTERINLHTKMLNEVLKK